MKKKSLHTKYLAHGKSDENGEPNWISAVATLINTDVIASGNKESIYKKNELFLTLNASVRLLRWNDSCMETGRKLS